MAAGCGRGENAAASEENHRALVPRAAENHAKMMLVGAGARCLFYPTLFYNVVRNRFQAEFRWWDEIDQFLLLGAVPFPRDIPRLKEAGVHAVVTLNESYETLVHTSLYKNQGINHLAIPTRDYLFAPSFVDLRRAVRFIHDHAQLGMRTYVHCKAGRGRSTTVVICYLVEHRGMTPLEALSFVRSKRPRVLLAASQWKAIQDYCDQVIKPQCYMTLSFHTSVATSSEAPSSTVATVEDLDLDLPVLVSKADLVGYTSIEDAGIIGNELWKDISFVCRFRLAAIRNFRAASAWIGTHSRGSSLETCKKMAASSPSPSSSSSPSSTSAYALDGVVVPVC
ncbi:putative dual specificity protein phosphatase DSP8 [Selaginella moellendorffii]|uniref:putative dual specificity protein phosphatase DSP8 n=1 Tax=Selaginella moellendorffii TaxID=88036 RepID=UPI000D1D0D04|nr:putative dual specificity protein phosphatase DSP8 [Selaginella moellendorffii]|eukprot:XP_002971940.2 putative dual specificity protein phosphatase DSP8 [Selaginella moellendorffii]